MLFILPPAPIPIPAVSPVQRIYKAEFMASNRKLSALLKGRMAQEITMQPDRVFLFFKDGSNLQVKTSAPVAPGSISVPSGPVRAVRQSDQSLMIDFEPAPAAPVPAPPTKTEPVKDKIGEDKSVEDKSAPDTSQVESPQGKDAPKDEAPLTITINTLEATACVMLRDGKGVLEYAD